MEDAGFTFRQLDYLILDRDDLLRPLAPSKKTVLQLTKTLYDGLNAIDRDHKDITKNEEATSDLVRTKAGLIFEQTVVEQIIGLLEGTTVYTTNAPENLVFGKDSLSKKIKYSNQPNATPTTASIQVTGILTDTEIKQAKAASNEALWPNAIDRVGKQTKNIINDALFGIFSDTADAQALLAGDVTDPNDSQYTAPGKRFCFLKKFLPFLRKRLSQRLVVDTLSGAAGLPSDVTNLLLSDILLVGASAQHAMAALEDVKNKPSGALSGWTGFLIPPADGAYSFVADSLKDDDQPLPIVIDAQSIPFTIQQELPTPRFVDS